MEIYLGYQQNSPKISLKKLILRENQKISHKFQITQIFGSNMKKSVLPTKEIAPKLTVKIAKNKKIRRRGRHTRTFKNKGLRLSLILSKILLKISKAFIAIS